MIKQKKGFTLIELLVVIAIIGILSAIGLVSLNGAREKARDSKARSDIATIRTALALWYDDHRNYYPGEAVNGTADISNSSAGSGATGIFASANAVTTEYLASINSPSTRRYLYITSLLPTSTSGSLAAALSYNLETAGGLVFYKYLINATGDSVRDIANGDAAAASCTDDAIGGGSATAPATPGTCS